MSGSDVCFFFKQKTAYEMRISDWSSDVCSSDLVWANVWMTDFIVRIDPATGNIASLLDLSTLKADAGASGTDSVLNGIAWDEKAKRLFVTVKNWPKLSQIALAHCR